MIVGFLRWLIFTLGLAGFVHLAAIIIFPSVVLHRVADQVETEVGVNQVALPPATSPAMALADRPSPDLLFAVCSYNVAGAPVRVTSPVSDTFWSLGLYDVDTKRFFSLNERQAGGRRVELVLVGPAGSAQGIPPSQIVEAPSFNGMVVIRFLVKDESDLPEIERLREQVTCTRLGA